MDYHYSINNVQLLTILEVPMFVLGGQGAPLIAYWRRIAPDYDACFASNGRHIYRHIVYIKATLLLLTLYDKFGLKFLCQ